MKVGHGPCQFARIHSPWALRARTAASSRRLGPEAPHAAKGPVFFYVHTGCLCTHTHVEATVDTGRLPQLLSMLLLELGSHGIWGSLTPSTSLAASELRGVHCVQRPHPVSGSLMGLQGPGLTELQGRIQGLECARAHGDVSPTTHLPGPVPPFLIPECSWSSHSALGCDDASVPLNLSLLQAARGCYSKDADVQLCVSSWSPGLGAGEASLSSGPYGLGPRCHPHTW